MVKKDYVKKTKKSDNMTRFQYTLKKLHLVAVQQALVSRKTHCTNMIGIDIIS
jgi:hypothetical protein